MGAHPLWVLADAHGGAAPRADEGLLALLDLAERAEADMLVLGDLFAGWLAPERFWTPFQQRVMARFASMRRRGRSIRFVVGNRDYLVRETLLGPVFDAVHEDEAVIDVAGVPTMVVHGDRVNEDDRSYAIWHRVTRSRPAKRFLSALPARVGQALVARTERALSHSNGRYKSGLLPIPALESLGRRALAQGASRVLVGHFHHDRMLDVAGGVPVVVCPGWFEHQRVLLGEANGILRSVPLEDLAALVRARTSAPQVGR